MPGWTLRSVGVRRTLLALTAGFALGCPQLLDDRFSSSAPDLGRGEAGGSAVSTRAASADAEPPALDTAPPDAAGAGGSAAQAGSGGTPAAGAGGGPTAGGAAGAGSTDGGAPDAGATPPGEDSGAPVEDACVPSSEVCDGRDNDCDNQVDQGATCATECRGLLISGRSYMYCGGSGVVASTAESRCQAQGMHLVRIDSAEENAALLSAVAPLDTELSTVAETQAAIWTAAQDIAVEGTWRWGASGTVFWLGEATGSAQGGAYVNWSSGKPNDNATNGEDCAVMYVASGSGTDGLGQWNDVACTEVHAFLCEQSP